MKTPFLEWRDRANSTTSEPLRQGVNSLIMLGAWILWNHRNRCVFYGAAPSIAGALAMAGEERQL